MCMADLVKAFAAEGIPVTEAQIRWAIKSGRVERPKIDGSLRFVFEPHHLAELRQHFAGSKPPPQSGVPSVAKPATFEDVYSHEAVTER